MTANPDFDDPMQLWPQADLGVLRNNRREPPDLPTGRQDRRHQRGGMDRSDR